LSDSHPDKVRTCRLQADKPPEMDKVSASSVKANIDDIARRENVAFSPDINFFLLISIS